MIEVYYYPQCPFCRMVVSAIEKLGISEGSEYVLRNILKDEKAREKLLDVGGKEQVPFIIDGDVSMYESRDIIGYFERKFTR